MLSVQLCMDCWHASQQADTRGSRSRCLHLVAGHAIPPDARSKHLQLLQQLQRLVRCLKQLVSAIADVHNLRLPNLLNKLCLYAYGTHREEEIEAALDAAAIIMTPLSCTVHHTVWQ